MTPMATVITFSSAIDGSHWTLALELQRCMPLWIPHAIVGVWGWGWVVFLVEDFKVPVI